MTSTVKTMIQQITNHKLWALSTAKELLTHVQCNNFDIDMLKGLTAELNRSLDIIKVFDQSIESSLLLDDDTNEKSASGDDAQNAKG